MAALEQDSTKRNVAPGRGPVTWDIRGWQNNWNWTVSLSFNEDEVSDEIVYQTRFPFKNLAKVYKGASASSPLLATITNNGFSAEITFPILDGTDISSRDPINMKNTAEESFSNRWRVKVDALGGREMQWEYDHPAHGNNCMYLRDLATEKAYGDANDNYLALNEDMDEKAVDELVITGTAAQIMLAPLMHNDMEIATLGPEGESQWKYQVPDWWDHEDEEENQEEVEDENEN